MRGAPKPLVKVVRKGIVESRGDSSGRRADLEAGYTQTFTEMVHVEVFSDLITEAEELQRAGYKDAAAVIAGSVLEEHLRKLAIKAEIAVEKPNGSPKKAEALNAELTAAGTYNMGIRNSAAHSKYEEYAHEQVAGMSREIHDVLTRLPA